MKTNIFLVLLSGIILLGCNTETTNNETANLSKNISENETVADENEFMSCSPQVIQRNEETGLVPLTVKQHRELTENPKPLNPDVPTIGLLMYDNILMTELTAPIDVFTKYSKDGEQLFNVITIAESYDFIVCEEGLKMFPDYTIENAPKLDVLIVSSTYDMAQQIKNEDLVNFIRNQNQNTEYTVSNCAGATLIGASGVADGKKIVTWIGGGEGLQEKFPDLLVQDDKVVTYMEDGKFISSNGNLATYISSLELLEKMTDKKHREFVEEHLYLDRLRNWKN